MDMFNLGPLPLGWECKIETKYGKLYFINHATKTTTWDDPRLATIPTPPYHIAITQPTAYFEDTIGSRWSSPLPSLKGFSLHRRGSSPRLGGSPRIAPSPTLPPRNKRNEQVILESRAVGGGSGGIAQAAASASVLQNQQQLFPYPHGAKANNASANAPTTAASVSPAKYNNYASQDTKGIPETIPERPNSRSSGCSSYYITSASNASTHISTSHLVSCDTDTAYKTICAMFPTAPETHVRHLFHKYHNRANLVVSALQVEKHPLSSDFSSNLIEIPTSRKNSGTNLDTDTFDLQHDNKSIGVSSPCRGTRSYFTDSSPARTGTPGSLMRFSNNQSSAGSLFTKSWGSPIPSASPQLQMGRETPGKLPTKSPNMKLKYMKGIFPAADETVLLDVLASCENNVQRASERLMKKGFTRTPPPKPARQKWLEVKSMIEKRQKALDQQKLVNFQHEMRGEPQESPFPTPIMKTARPHVTAQQKNDAQKCLMNKFPNLPDRFIAWALEVAQFQQEKAERLLKEVCPQTPEEFKPFITTVDKTTSMSTRTLSTDSTTMDVDEDSSNKSDESRSKREEEDRLEQLNKENVLPLMTKSSSKTFADKELQTPDSGYFEPEHKPRKKGFLASLFSWKSDKPAKLFSQTSKKAKGANPSKAKGPNPALIQKTYVQALGPSQQMKGPNPNNRTGSQYQVKGPNPSLVHGPMWSAAVNKSRYSNKPSVTFDVVGGHDF